KRKAFEEVYFFRITALEGMEEWGMLSGAAENIAAGKAFDKKNKPGDPAAVFKKYKKQIDDEFKKVKSTK
ncbi:MAG TPA: hypothetical protein VI603_03525, partial [Saprospiraceae bacterium]|nr:hypothetical protein [Saprospiraceae bacterium]